MISGNYLLLILIILCISGLGYRHIRSDRMTAFLPGPSFLQKSAFEYLHVMSEISSLSCVGVEVKKGEVFRVVHRVREGQMLLLNIGNPSLVHDPMFFYVCVSTFACGPLCLTRVLYTNFGRHENEVRASFYLSLLAVTTSSCDNG